MRRVLAAAGVPRLVRRLPARLAAGEPRSLFTPAFVSDRSDGKIAHLDGVNLSRAWCWRGLAGALDPDLAALAPPHRRRASRRQPAACRRRLYGRALARHLRAAGAGGRREVNGRSLHRPAVGPTRFARAPSPTPPSRAPPSSPTAAASDPGIAVGSPAGGSVRPPGTIGTNIGLPPSHRSRRRPE